MKLTGVQAPKQTVSVHENVIATEPPLRSVVLKAPKLADNNP